MRNYRVKRFFSIFAVAISVFVIAMAGTAVIPVAMATMAKAPPYTHGGTLVVTNGIYTLSVEDTLGSNGVGTYTISTGASHPNPYEDIFYAGASQSPWSTYLTVRVYDTFTEYISSTDTWISPSAGYTLGYLDACNPVTSQVGNEIVTMWTTPENLFIQQVTAIEGTTLSNSRVRVTTTVTNQDTAAHSVGIRYEWDIMIDGEDGSWFAERIPDGPWLDTEMEWVSPTFERYEITNDPHNPVFSIFGTVTGPAVLAPTPPDLLQFAAWWEIYDHAFDYSPVGHDIAGTDSAIGYYWGNNETNKITLEPGENVSVTTYLFAVPPVNTPPSTDPVTVTDLSSPTPTINWAYFDAEGDPQVQYEVEVWTGPGGTGTCMWDPPVGTGTITSVMYAGDPLVSGETYYARVRAYDGMDWGDWSEASFEITVIPTLCPDEYRWSIHHTPPYEWDPFPMLFRSWTDVHFVNSGSGDAYNVTATITCAPVNVNIVDGDVTLGDIPAGSSAWSQDFFMLEVDMTNPQDPNKGIVWRLEYDDAAGVHHVIEDIPTFCGEPINCP